MAPKLSVRKSPTEPSVEGGLSSPQESEARKRVTKACDRCRLKKIKCDGQMPCSRCQVESTVCRFGERKKSVERRIPPGYIEYLEEQQKVLVKALKKCWSQNLPSGSIWEGNPDPPIHTILEDLGVFSETSGQPGGEASFDFEEDLENLRTKCETDAEGQSSTSQPPSYEPTPATSPEKGMSRSASVIAREGLYRNPWDPPQPGSAPSPDPQHQSQYYQQMPQMQHAATFPPTLYPQPSRPDWRFRPHVQIEAEVERASPYGQDPSRYQQGSSMDWTDLSMQEYQQAFQDYQQRQRQQQQNQQRPHTERTLSQPEISTVSPRDLAISPGGPSSQQFELPDEETFIRWIREQEQQE